MRPAELIGQTLDQKYYIDSQLGQGGMGAVYVATHLGTKRPVAVKIIIPQFMVHAEFVERFRREAEAAGRLCHPNVVNVTDFGFATVGQNRIAYLVMEYLQGCTLGEVLKEESKLRLEFVINIVEQICAAIEAAHQQGIIHRDLKPDNIWLEPNGYAGYTVKVLDFGLAKLSDNLLPDPTGKLNPETVNKPTAEVSSNISRVTAAQLPKIPDDFQESATQAQVPKETPSIPSLIEADETETNIQLSSNDEEKTQIQTSQSKTNANLTKKTEQLTRVGSILGTPIYMSPEQCKGEELDKRSDIYSLGIMVYEMLAGETPFTGNMNTLLTHHLKTTPPSLREKRKDIPKAVADLVMSTLAKDPSQRPTSAAAFASALRARSETAFTLLKQSLTFYTENFTTIFRLSLLSYSLVILPTVLLTITGVTSGEKPHFAFTNNTIDTNLSHIQIASIAINGLLLVFGYLIATVASLVVFTPTLAQLRLFPVRSTKINIVKTIKKHLRAVLATAPHLYGRIILATACCFIPALVLNIIYLLVYPVIVVEGLQGKAALDRSKELISRVKWTASLTWILMIIIPTAVQAVLSPYIKQLTQLKHHSMLLNIAINVFASLIELSPNILVTPIICLMTSLLYFKACQYQGEGLSENFRQQLEEENVLTNWQKQMQQQIRTRTRISTYHPTKPSL